MRLLVSDRCPDRSPSNRSHSAPALVEAIAPLVAALSVETNPAPLKAALEILGLCGGELRLPLVSVAPESRARIHEALVVAGLTPA